MRGLSANISLLYQPLPFDERLCAAAEDGFSCVEFWVAAEHASAQRRLADLGLSVSCTNVDPGPHPESAGLSSDPASVEWWRAEFSRTVEFALAIGCPAINVLAGGRSDVPAEAQERTLLTNLEWALAASPAELTLLIEPLNRLERRHYLVHTIDDAARVRQALGHPERLRILFDVYHLGQEGEDVAALFREHATEVGHVQVADAPGRRAPGSGSIDFASFWEALTGRYDGWVALEYEAADGSADLDWLKNTPTFAPAG